MKSYELHLPVFKKGDDLSWQIKEAEGDLSKAFEVQAEIYEEAARLCKLMSEETKSHPLEIQADTHMIVVEGPKEVLEALVKKGLLIVEEFEDEEFEDDVEPSDLENELDEDDDNEESFD